MKIRGRRHTGGGFSSTKGLNDEIHQYRLRQYGRRRESGRCRQPGQRSYKASDTGREGYGRAIDVTCGKRTRAVLITDSEHVVLSALKSETISNRLRATDEPEEEDDEEDEI